MNTVECWRVICQASTGISNQWELASGRYLFVIHTVHADGTTEGVVRKLSSIDTWRKHSTFRIEPDGTMKDIPTPIRLMMAGKALMS